MSVTTTIFLLFVIAYVLAEILKKNKVVNVSVGILFIITGLIILLYYEMNLPVVAIIGTLIQMSAGIYLILRSFIRF